MKKLNLDKTNNIELRSDKVRGIIGQIPPWIVRSGTTVIIIVVSLLLIGSYYIKYPSNITTTINFLEISDCSFQGIITIPAHKISKVRKGQSVEINLDQTEHLKGLIFFSRVKEISKKITIFDKRGYYIAKVENIENLNICEPTSGTAKIITDNKSFFDRVMIPDIFE